MAAFEVLHPGLLTTVQDLGRWGHQALGVPVAGPMDVVSHRMANQLVRNTPLAATLEVTMLGPRLRCVGAVTIAVAGAEFDVRVDGQPIRTGCAWSLPDGAVLAFGPRRAGTRAYLAVAGGIDTPVVLGSRATHLVCGMGGVEGRALRAGDRLPIGQTAPGQVLPAGASWRDEARALPGGTCTLRILPGPQRAWFTDAAWAALLEGPYQLAPASNRMGYRLQGPTLGRAREGELLSEPVAMGAVQVPGSGDPLLLMAECQTMGGYPKIAVVIAADLPAAGQLAPGDTVQFAACSRSDAMAALIRRERALLREEPS